MKRITVVVQGLAALAVAFGLSLTCWAGVEFFPLEQVTVGLKGTGKTVIRGTEIETFNFEVVDIVPEGGFDGGPMILARFSGPVVDFSDGIASGYSGSPVYIGEKLLGAVSTAMPYTDTHIGGITPIASMLGALPSRYVVDYSGNTVVPEPEIKRKLQFKGSLRGQPGEESQATMVGLSAPLIVSGATPYLMAMLRERFKDNPFVDVIPGAMIGGQRPGGLLYDPAAERPLQPGDAIAVSLVTGDIDISAIGTVTYIDDRGQILAFGHPLLLSGETSMPVGKAYIAYTYKSSLRAFKSGYCVNTVGSITQDRMCALGGMLGEIPDTIPLRIEVNDIDFGRRREFKVAVIREPDYFDSLISGAVMEAFMRTVDSSKGGTIRLKFMMNGVGLKEPVERTNYHYDTSLPIGLIYDEAIPLASLLTNNIYREVKLTDFQVTVDFTRNRVNASIDDAKLLLPGEKEEAKETEAADGEAAPGESGEGAEEAAEQAPDLEGNPERGEESPQSQASGFSGREVQGIAFPTPQMPPAGPPYSPAEPPKTVHPGDTLRIPVRLQPYRQEHVMKTLYVTLPEDFPLGFTNIVIHGGGSLVSILNEFGGRGRMLMGSGSFVQVDSDIHDLDEIIEKALGTPLNNEVVVSIARPEQPQAGMSEGGGASGGGAEGAADGEASPVEPEFRVSVPTEWVIYNQQVIPINVVPKAGARASRPQAEATPPAEEPPAAALQEGQEAPEGPEEREEQAS